MVKFHKHIFLSLIIFLLSGCKIIPDPPEILPPSPRPQSSVTDISVPTYVSISQANADINNAIPWEIYRKSGKKNKNNEIILDGLETQVEVDFDREEYIRILRSTMLNSGEYSASEIEDAVKNNNEHFDEYGDLSLLPDGSENNKGDWVGASYRVIVNRKAINLDVGQDKIVYNFGATADGRVDGFLCIVYAFGKCRVKIKHHEDARVNLDASFSTKIDINENWSLNTQTAGDIRLTEAYITLGPFKLSLRSLIQPGINYAVNSNVDKIDKAIAKAASLRERSEQYWPSINSKFELSKDPALWLLLEPQMFFYEGLSKTPDGEAKFGIGINSLTELSVLEEPAQPTERPLPAIERRDSTGQFTIDMPIYLQLNEANKIISERLGAGGKIIAKDNVKVTIKNVELYANGENIVAKIHLKTSRPWIIGSKGYIFIHGKPEYDSQNRIVYFSGTDFDVQTNNYLLNKAAYLLHKPLLEELNSALKIDVGDEIDNAKEVAKDKLGNVQMSENVRMIVSPDILDIENIFTSENKYLGLSLQVSGNSKIVVD